MTAIIILKLLMALTIPLLLGYSIINNIFRSTQLPYTLLLPLSFGLGMGVVSYSLLALHILNIPFDFYLIAFPMVTLILLLLIYRMKHNSNKPNPLAFRPDPKLSSIQQFLLLLGIVYIMYNTIYVFWRSLSIPIKEWDAISFVAFKAKVFFHEKSIYRHAELPHRSYPLHLSLVQTWIALAMNQWHHTLVKAVLPITYLSCISMTYAFLRFWVSRLWSLLGVVLIVSSNIFIFHSTIGYKDFTVMYYNCSVIMLLMLWRKHGHRGFLILASVFAGISSFVKNEAALYIAVYIFILGLIVYLEKKQSPKDKLKNMITFAVPSIGLCLIYQLYRVLSKVTIQTYDTQMGFAMSQLNRLEGIISMFVNILLISSGWNIVWFLFFISVLQYKKIVHNQDMQIIVLSVFGFIGLYSTGLLLSPQYEFFKEISQFTVLSRIVLHFFPLSAIAIVLINGQKSEPLDR